jgi:flagellar biosynthesis/type III secretory pathway M-ring protein FliF/YscJ
VAIMLLFLFVIRPLMAALMAPANGSQPMQRAGAQGNTPGERAMETKVTPGKEQLVDWAKKNPGDAASLVKGWMDEK